MCTDQMDTKKKEGRGGDLVKESFRPRAPFPWKPAEAIWCEEERRGWGWMPGRYISRAMHEYV